MKIQIRFDGPPGPVSGRFIEVEDEQGRGVKVGEWKQDGTDWLLIIPYNQAELLKALDAVRLIAENEPTVDATLVTIQRIARKAIRELS